MTSVFLSDLKSQDDFTDCQPQSMTTFPKFLGDGSPILRLTGEQEQCPELAAISGS